MRKTMLVASASIFGICVLVIAAKAATTWQGPPSNCTSPDTTLCNTDGVVWNRSTPQQTGSFNLSGTGQLGNGLTIVSGDLNANSLIYLQTNGDLRLTDTKSIRIDKGGSQSQLYVGNYSTLPGNSNIKVTIFGDLETATENFEGYTTKISTPTLCLNGDCKSAWPAVGGGGTVTGATAGGGLLLTGTTLGLSTSCANGQIMKWNGASWACAADGSNTGTVTSISQGTGITATPNPITGAGTIALNTTYTDGRYVDVSGDTMTGQLTIERSPAVWPSLSAVNGIQSNSLVQIYSQLSVNSFGLGVYAAAPTAGSFAGTAYGIIANGEPGGMGGSFQNKPSGLPVTKRVDLATQNNAVEAIMGNIKLNTGNSLCFDTDCRSSWPAASTGDLTDVLSGTGVSVANSAGPQPTVSLQTSYQMPQSCTNGQVPKSNGSGAWVCAADMNSGGTVTAVNAGTGITSSGGTTPTIAMSATYRLPQGCTINATPFSDGAGNWVCHDVNPGTGLGHVMGDLNILQGYRLPQTCSKGQMPYQSGLLTWGCTSNLTWDGTNGRLGIGTSAPTQSLDVSGNANISGVTTVYQLQTAGSPYNGMYFNNRTAGTQWGLYSDNIGGLNAAALWSGTNKFYINNNGQAWKSNLSASWDNPSDERLKDIHGNFTAGLKEITQLQPIKFTYKKDNPLKLPSDVDAIGFSAQEVLKVLPEAVTKDGMGYLNLKTDPILWAEVNAIKELKIQNDMLQAENDMLLHRIEALEEKLK